MVRLLVMAERVVAMEVRLMVALAGRIGDERLNVTAVCAELGISRDSFYRYRRRFTGAGLEGLVPRSRRPHRSPGQTPGWLEQLIVQLRHELEEDGWDCGARSIRYALLRRGIVAPTARTIHRVLVRRGEISPQPQKRPRSSWRRFEFADPNGCWQIDGTEWKLADGSDATVLRVLDDHSRKTLASRAAPGENGQDAWACMLSAMTRHGRPAIVLSDAGSVFSARRVRGGVCTFEANLRALGILPVVASSHHPQTCGKKEREWQTLKRWLRARPAARTLEKLQQQLDLYDAAYNADRPHQALGGQTPDERYAARPKAGPQTSPLATPPTVRECTVAANGQVAIGNRQLAGVGIQWQHARVTVFRDGDQVAIFYRDQLIRSLRADPTRRYQPLGSRPGGTLRPRLALPASSLPSTSSRGEKRSTCSARSAARTNDVDSAEPRHTITQRGSGPNPQPGVLSGMS